MVPSIQLFPRAVVVPAAGTSNDNARRCVPLSPFAACLMQGDCIEIMGGFAAQYPNGLADLVFADPPYRLSNGGWTCKNGRWARVDKGPWDRSRGLREDHAWNRAWLAECQRVVKPGGTVWVTASQHNIFSVGFAMRELGMKILNVISWEKPDPPPNLCGKYFTHSTEFLVWSAKDETSGHRFNRDWAMKLLGSGGQTVWRIAPPGPEEKRFGKHSTQKPIALLRTVLLASTLPNALVIDPFVGSGTTAVACVETGRKCIGIDLDIGYLDLAGKRVNLALTERDVRLATRRAG